MSDTTPIMTVFVGTNGAGKSTLSMQMRGWLGELVDPDQIARELIPDNPRSLIYCVKSIPDWSRSALVEFR